MTELAAQTLSEAEERIDHLVRKIGELEDAKRGLTPHAHAKCWP